MNSNNVKKSFEGILLQVFFRKTSARLLIDEIRRRKEYEYFE